ncbi:MAG: ribosomal protein S18-alanine N-acetyltransferase [Spirochaetes bacterium]|jgi:ribosomal-protein-alanine N-acetyltransferase|nr:ribosomal protein S18-alanine N-acetyltransferase [Spirochaetota bacterium]
MNITEATVEAIKTVADLESRNYDTPYPEEDLKLELQRNDSLFLCSYNDSGILTGYLIARYILGECEIHRITVAADFRRTGIAEALLNNLEKICIDHTAYSIFLEVNEKNVPACNFYHKKGFFELSRRKKYYGSADALILRKRIAHVNDTEERIC